jgi:hypothetical protein
MSRSTLEYPGGAARITQRTGPQGMPIQERTASVEEAAKQEVENLHNLWSELPAPGRHVVHLDDRPGEAPTHKSTAVYGVTSPRPAVESQFPWLNDLPMMTLSRVKAALQRQSGVDYDRIVKAASDYITKQRGL